MQDTLKIFNLNFSGSIANENDFVAIVLGGNKGESEQANVRERLAAILTAPDLLKPKYDTDADGNRQKVSAHSSYKCEFNCGIK